MHSKNIEDKKNTCNLFEKSYKLASLIFNKNINAAK